MLSRVLRSSKQNHQQINEENPESNMLVLQDSLEPLVYQCALWVPTVCAWEALIFLWRNFYSTHVPKTTLGKASAKSRWLWSQFLYGDFVHLQSCPCYDDLKLNSQRKKVKVKSEVAQSCPTLCDPMDCSLPGFSVHSIFQARVPEWVANSFSRGSSWPRDWTQALQADALTSEPPGKPIVN